MKRSLLRSSSQPRWGRRRRRRPGRLAPTDRIPRRLQMHIIDEPAAAIRPHHVERQHLVAVGALQLDPIGAQVVAPRHGERPFDDAIPGMVEVLLDDGETLAQHFGVHRSGGGPALRAPELAHPFLIVGFYGGEKLRDRLVHRLRDRRAGAGVLAARGACQQNEIEREPSLHESTPKVRTNRR